MHLIASSIVSTRHISFGSGRPHVPEQLRPLPIGVDRHRVDLAEPVGEKSQPALGDDLRVEPAEGAAREVARVGVRLLALGLDLLVHPLEVLIVHVDFAADFEDRRELAASPFASGASRSGTELIVRALTVTSSPTFPVAARRGQHEHARPRTAG